jgi:hypothetical protein
MGINYKGSQGQTERAVVLQEDLPSDWEMDEYNYGTNWTRKGDMLIYKRFNLQFYVLWSALTIFNEQ